MGSHFGWRGHRGRRRTLPWPHSAPRITIISFDIASAKGARTRRGSGAISKSMLQWIEPSATRGRKALARFGPGSSIKTVALASVRGGEHARVGGTRTL